MTSPKTAGTESLPADPETAVLSLMPCFSHWSISEDFMALRVHAPDSCSPGVLDCNFRAWRHDRPLSVGREN